MLNSKQRAYLRGLAMKISPVFQIGKAGIGDEAVNQISNALEARELVKITVLDNSGYTAGEAAEELSALLKCDVVTTIGAKIVLYRESQKKKRIELP